MAFRFALLYCLGMREHVLPGEKKADFEMRAVVAKWVHLWTIAFDAQCHVGRRLCLLKGKRVYEHGWERK